MKIQNKKDKIIKSLILLLIPLQVVLNSFSGSEIGSVLAASSPWVQTDWSGGQSSSVATGPVTTYLSSTGANTSGVGNVSVNSTTGWSGNMAAWAKRKPVTVNNSQGAQSNYQIKLSITYDSDMPVSYTHLDVYKRQI